MSSTNTPSTVAYDPCSVAAAFAAELEMPPVPTQGSAPDVRTLDDLGFPSYGSDTEETEDDEDADEDDPELALCLA